jgi:hypothetical protein
MASEGSSPQFWNLQNEPHNLQEIWKLNTDAVVKSFRMGSGVKFHKRVYEGFLEHPIVFGPLLAISCPWANLSILILGARATKTFTIQES